MALLRIDAGGARPAIEASALAVHLAPLPPGAALIVVTHGMRHRPGGPGTDDPHRGVLCPVPRRDRPWRAKSLVRGLHLGRGQRLDGHGIAFAWDGGGAPWRAMKRAEAAGGALAAALERVRTVRPDLVVGFAGHSLGARVALAAMEAAPVPVLDRVLLLAPSEHRARAARAMAAAGAAEARVLSVQPRANRSFAGGFALATGAPGLWRGPDHPRWRDLRPGTPPGAAPLCHWSAYLRPDLWPLWRAWLHDGRMPPGEALATAALPTAGCAA